MLAGYFCVFLITPYPLKWQLESSLSRLIVQLWPLLLTAVFAGLRDIEHTAAAPPAAPLKARKKARA